MMNYIYMLLASDKIKSTYGLIKKVTSITKGILGPILSVIGIAGVIYAIFLGVNYAKAEDSSKRKEVQGRLVGTIIGVVIMIVGVTMVFAINWNSLLVSMSGITHTYAASSDTEKIDGDVLPVACIHCGEASGHNIHKTTTTTPK